MIIGTLAGFAIATLATHQSKPEDYKEPEETISEMDNEAWQIRLWSENVKELRTLRDMLQRDVERNQPYARCKILWTNDFGEEYETDVADSRLILEFIENEIEYYSGMTKYVYSKFRKLGDSMDEQREPDALDKAFDIYRKIRFRIKNRKT